MSDESKKAKNVEPDLIPLLPWGSAVEKQESIKHFYEMVQVKYQSVINWYLQRKSGKRCAAQWLRCLSIILISLAAAGLAVTAANAGENWARWPGTISSIFLFIAAGLIAYDRFFGFSSSWIRFILTAITFQKELNRFQIEVNRLSLLENQNRDEILKLKMEQIQGAYDFLYSELQGESHQWAEEFRGHLDRSITELVEEIKAGRGK